MKQNFTRYIIVETVSFFNCFSHLIENYVVEIKDKRFPERRRTVCFGILSRGGIQCRDRTGLTSFFPVHQSAVRGRFLLQNLRMDCYDKSTTFVPVSHHTLNTKADLFGTLRAKFLVWR